MSHGTNYQGVIMGKVLKALDPVFLQLERTEAERDSYLAQGKKLQAELDDSKQTIKRYEEMIQHNKRMREKKAQEALAQAEEIKKLNKIIKNMGYLGDKEQLDCGF